MHEIWRDTYFDVIEEWRQRYGNGHLEIRKMKIKEANLFNTVGSCIYWKKLNIIFILVVYSDGDDYILYVIQLSGRVYYMLFSYQTGYIMWHSRLILCVCLTENHAKSKKNVTKLISVRKKSYTFSKYLMSSILKYIIHISYIFL
jgi:hypothetical protein